MPRTNKSKLKLKPKPIYYILCEGDTERIYFRRVLDSKRYPTSEVKSYGKSPKVLLLKAKKLLEKVRLEQIDKIFIVFDKDNFEKVDFNGTIEKSNNTEIGCIWSNPCFELWLWLHIKDVNSKLETKECVEKFSKDFQSTFGIEYSKTKTMCIQKLDTPENRELAIKRAKKLDDAFNSSQNYADQIPNTTVYKLVKEILNSPNI